MVVPEERHRLGIYQRPTGVLVNDKMKQFMQKVHEVTEFCVQNRGRCFQGWKRETIFLYVAFHAGAGTLFLMRENGNVKAVGFAWPTFLTMIQDAFNWRLPGRGDILFISEVVGDRKSIKTLYNQAKAKWPHLFRVFAYRFKGGPRQRLVELTHIMERFCG